MIQRPFFAGGDATPFALVGKAFLGHKSTEAYKADEAIITKVPFPFFFKDLLIFGPDTVT